MTTENNVFETLVGEDKKFKSPDDLAKAKLEADAFVERLKEENSALRAIGKTVDTNSEKLAAMAAILEKIKGEPSTGGYDRSGDKANANNQSISGLSRDDVMKLFEEMENERRQEGNKKFANKKLAEVFGDKAHEVLKNKAEELGVSMDQMQEVARRSPSAFFNMIGLNGENKSRSSTQRGSSVNTEALEGSSGSGETGVRNNAYYEKLKKDMGAKKFAFDVRLQQQMWKDINRLGDAFYTE